MTSIKEQFDAGVKVVQSFAKHGGIVATIV